MATGNGASEDAELERAREGDKLLAGGEAPAKQPRGRQRVPAFALPLLIGAVLAVSSAAVVFTYMRDVPPVTLAAWRLQATSAVLLVGFVFQWHRLDKSERRHTWGASHLLALSGCLLGAHFGLWVWGLRHTSLAHSLLFVSVSPILIAAGTWALGWPISRLELVGTAVGVAGVGVLASGGMVKKQHGVHVMGDLASLAGAVTASGYLLLGAHMRSWMPIYIYAMPVTATAAMLLTLVCPVLEGSSVARVGPHGVFGWLASVEHLPYVLYLALGPGLLGHTGLNTLLRYLPPLAVTLSLSMEPVVGSLLGWALRVSPFPNLWTICSGGILLSAVVLVVVASHRREAEDRRRGACSTAARPFEEPWAEVGEPGPGDVELQ
eukprot:evm.model.scf_1521.2 EVM.evm.TU.scf_1521.2   scf_1521:18740-24069(+)